MRPVCESVKENVGASKPIQVDIFGTRGAKVLDAYTGSFIKRMHNVVAAISSGMEATRCSGVRKGLASTGERCRGELEIVLKLQNVEGETSLGPARIKQRRYSAWPTPGEQARRVIKLVRGSTRRYTMCSEIRSARALGAIPLCLLSRVVWAPRFTLGAALRVRGTQDSLRRRSGP